MSKKVLITDYVHPLLISGLKELDYEVHYQKDIKPDAVFKLLPTLTGIVINSKIKMLKEQLARGQKLEFIARLGSGLEIIDIPLAQSMGISVMNSPEGNRRAVAEHALGMFLSLSNKLVKGNQEVKAFTWNREENRGFEIGSKSIGIIGFGNTGVAFAELLEGFGVTVRAYDKYKENYSLEFNHVLECDLQELLKECDVLSFHLPLTPETKYFFDSELMAKCRKGTIIINTSRGQVVDTKALIKGLKSGQIGGACLDVFENEKTSAYTHNERLMYEDLFQFEQVIVSPHVAGWTHESLEKIASTLLQKINSL